jgi:hypothetical protein
MKISVKQKFSPLGTSRWSVSVGCSGGMITVGEMDTIAGRVSSHPVEPFEVCRWRHGGRRAD